MSDSPKTLSPMQLRFAEEMILDPSSQKQAAIRAGYSISSASQEAARLMKNKLVQKTIAEAHEKGVKTCGITAARIIQELALIAFAKPGDAIRVNAEGEAEVDLNDLSKDKSSGMEVSISTVSSAGKKSRAVSVKTVKPADKLNALVKLGQHLGMFKEQLEVTGKLSLADLVEQSIQESLEKTKETAH